MTTTKVAQKPHRIAESIEEKSRMKAELAVHRLAAKKPIEEEDEVFFEEFQPAEEASDLENPYG